MILNRFHQKVLESTGYFVSLCLAICLWDVLVYN